MRPFVSDIDAGADKSVKDFCRSASSPFDAAIKGVDESISMFGGGAVLLVVENANIGVVIITVVLKYFGICGRVTVFALGWVVSDRDLKIPNDHHDFS